MQKYYRFSFNKNPQKKKNLHKVMTKTILLYLMFKYLNDKIYMYLI